MKNKPVVIPVLGSDYFKESIEALVKAHNLSYIDAVVHFCQQNNIEMETAASIIKASSKMKKKIKVEATDLNLMKKKRPRTETL